MIMSWKGFQYISRILVSSLLISQINETLCSTDCTHKTKGMEDGAITNDMITSSSSLEGHSAQEARPTSINTGWIPETNNAGQEWIQVKFPFAHLVTGIVNEWVHETHVSYTDLSSFNANEEEETQTMDQESFRIEYGPYESALLSTEEVQTTNIDPVYTRIFRIIPLSTNLQQFGLKFEILGCDPTSCQCPEECYHVPLGMVDGSILTEQISIMYYGRIYNWIDNARLNDNYGLRISKYLFQWLQVTFDEIHIISGVITKGYYSTHYVETFDIELGLEPNNLQRVKQTFIGNKNRINTEVVNIFEAQFSRIFRIIPLSTSSNRYIGLRLEILGCYITKSCGCFVGSKNKLQGLMDGRISDRHLSASSQYEMIDGYGPASARLQNHVDDQSLGCWVPNGMTDEWIQVGFSGTRLLTGVATQGCHSNHTGQWVHEFNIAVGFQGTVLTTLDETFIGNTDANTVVVNVFTPVYANVMQLIPISTGSIFFGLRFDIYGCMIPDECKSDEFDVRIDDAGFVEIQFNGEGWGRACKEGFDNHEADLVCKYLGYSRSKTKHNSKDHDYEQIAFKIHCDDGDTSLLQCDVTQESQCSASRYQTVECETYFQSNELEARLDDEGIIEIKFEEDWGRICMEEFSNHEADLVCIYLGYSKGQRWSAYDDSDYDRRAFRVHCEDDYSSLIECDFTEEDGKCVNDLYQRVKCKYAISSTDTPTFEGELCPASVGFNITRRSTKCFTTNTLLVDIHHTFTCSGHITGWKFSEFYTDSTLGVQFCNVRQKLPELAVYTIVNCTTIRVSSGSADGQQVVEASSPNDWIAVQAGDRIGININYGYIFCDDFESGLDAVRLLYYEMYRDYWVQNGDEFAFSSWVTRAYSFAAIMDTGCPDLSWTYYNKWCFRSSNVNTRQGGSDECGNVGAVLMPRFTEFVFLEELISSNSQVWTDEIHGKFSF